MPNVLALFDDAQRLEEAEAALAGHGADDDVVRVFRAQTPTADRSKKPSTRQSEERVVSQQGEVAMVGSPAGSAADLGLEPFGEAGEYFWRAHQDGAHLMVLDVDEPERAAETLDQAGAQRVHTV